ncbi:MAG: hypothetical protein WDM77_15390 [Steroidobacteraceae bacterium]
MRYLILIHRYLGTAIGIVMVGWCLSGVVMMYVRYPELSQLERVRHLQPLDFHHCCTLGANSLPDDAAVEDSSSRAWPAGQYCIFSFPTAIGS